MSEEQSPYDHGDGEVKTSCGSVFEDLGVECFDAKEFVAGFDRQYGNTVPIHPRHEIILQAALDRAKALREENAKLKQRVDYIEKRLIKTQSEFIDRNAQYGKALHDVETLRSQAEKLREALEPLIADVRDDWSGAPDDATVDLFATVGQCRAARAAYEETSDPVCKESLHGDNTSKSVGQQSEIGDAQPVNRILHDTEGKPG